MQSSNGTVRPLSGNLFRTVERDSFSRRGTIASAETFVFRLCHFSLFETEQLSTNDSGDGKFSMALLNGNLTSRRFQLTVRWTLVIALWALLMSMASGQAGISNYVELVSKRNVLVDVNMGLKIENQLLEEKIKRLKTNATEQVRFLKEEYGYVQPGEYVYRFETRAKPQNQRTGGSKIQPAPQPPNG